MERVITRVRVAIVLEVKLVKAILYCYEPMSGVVRSCGGERSDVVMLARVQDKGNRDLASTIMSCAPLLPSSDFGVEQR